jgi:adenylyltransferase/sulfurtransferase
VIGSWQALETIKLITGCGDPLLGRLLIYDALNQSVNTLPFGRDAKCGGCSDTALVQPWSETASLTDSCATNSDSSMTDTDASFSEKPLEISVHETKSLLDTSSDQVTLIDVREPHEWQICHVDGAEHIPMRQIPENAANFDPGKHYLIMCHHGGRSMRVTEYLRAQGLRAITNVAGGIDAWAREIEPGMLRY